MQAQATPTKGQIVKFTRGPLGTIAHPDASAFEDEVVNKGDSGTFEGPHPNEQMEDWFLVRVVAGGRERWVPVHSSQIEVA